MHKEALTKSTRSVLYELGDAGVVKPFYLAGGTALALYYGHRFSVDLDWFAEKFVNNGLLRRQLEKIGRLTIDFEYEHSLKGLLNQVSVSFLDIRINSFGDLNI